MASFLPRLHFAGDFQTDPSTVNNDPRHFDTANFRSSYQLFEDDDDRNGWWNPVGGAVFRFHNCRITGAVDSNGQPSDSDAAIGEPIHDSLAAPPAKMVDLDSQQQMSSVIWGLVVSLGDPTDTGFLADFKPAVFSDIWGRTTASDPTLLDLLGAVWGGILTFRGAVKPGKSAILAEFAKYKALRFRFVVDGYNTMREDPRFTFGRCVGTLSPLVTPGPRHPISYRPMFAVRKDNLETVNTAFAQVNSSVPGHWHVTVDLGNSLPTASIGGDFRDIGILMVAYRASSNEPIRTVGPNIPYLEKGWYNRTAGMFTFSVSTDVATELEGKPMMVVSVPRPQDKPEPGEMFITRMAEKPDGLYVWAEDYILRAQPGGEVSSTLRATRFGVPQNGVEIFFTKDSTIAQSQEAGGPPVGVPESALDVPKSISTDANGAAVVTIGASDPGNPRGYIDGQVYGVAYGPGAPPVVGAVTSPSDILSILVFNHFDRVESPTWVGQVQPIMTQYANLYPVMRPMVDLASYSSVLSRLQALRIVFNLPFDDPNYMPVTRDMSKEKRETIQRWMVPKEPVYMDLSSYDELCTVLQYAIELEHATIPVYLEALYSIKPGRNVEVAAVIRSVLVEEMLHMALVANLLLSIGGSPNFGKPGFIPSYPGPLPGGVGTGLTARLRKCSIEQIRDVFMAIELPGELAIISNGASIPCGPTITTKYTIGWFYEQISAALKAQRQTLVFGQNEEKQPDKWDFEDTELFKIRSFEDAEKAIKIIVEQGEGNGAFDPSDDDGMGLSHYYLFAEIVAGRKLVYVGDDEKGKKQFSYTGSAVPFDEDGVYNIIDDPVLASFKEDSRARLLTEVFSDTYQTMMNNLHIAFNGKPENLKHAIGLMYTMSAHARELMITPSGRDDGTFAGVAFQAPVDTFSAPRQDQFVKGSMKILAAQTH